MSVGSFLRSQRRRRGLDIGSMAMAIGISKGHLSEFENDKEIPKANSLLKILAFFQMTELQFKERAHEHQAQLSDQH